MSTKEQRKSLPECKGAAYYEGAADGLLQELAAAIKAGERLSRGRAEQFYNAAQEIRDLERARQAAEAQAKRYREALEEIFTGHYDGHSDCLPARIIAGDALANENLPLSRQDSQG